MDMDVIGEVLLQIEHAGIKSVSFTGMGEPLLHPQIVDAVRLARRRGLYPFMSTNALLLSRDMAEGLKDAGLEHLFISLHGTRDEQAYRRTCGVVGYERAIAGIAHAHDAVLGYTIHHVQVRANQNNYPQVFEAVHTLTPHRHVNMIRTRGHNRGGAVHRDVLLEPERTDVPKRCKVWMHNAFVSSDANLLLCCNDVEQKHIVGNLLKTPLKVLLDERGEYVPQDVCQHCTDKARW